MRIQFIFAAECKSNTFGIINRTTFYLWIHAIYLFVFNRVGLKVYQAKISSLFDLFHFGMESNITLSPCSLSKQGIRRRRGYSSGSGIEEREWVREGGRPWGWVLWGLWKGERRDAGEGGCERGRECALPIQGRERNRGGLEHLAEPWRGIMTDKHRWHAWTMGRW